MPYRDEDDFERKRQQIIDGALEVFASKGFEKATNKDIADAAGVRSPGLIYHYFKDKADVFRAVLEHRAPALQLLGHPDELMALPPRELLTLLGNSFMESIGTAANVPMFKLLLGEAIRRPTVAAMLNTIGPSRVFDVLTRYLQRQMDQGVLRRMDPGAAARCFIGPLIVYVITSEVFKQPDTARLTAQTMVETAVDIFLEGMQPANGAAE